MIKVVFKFHYGGHYQYLSREEMEFPRHSTVRECLAAYEERFTPLKELYPFGYRLLVNKYVDIDNSWINRSLCDVESDTVFISAITKYHPE